MSDATPLVEITDADHAALDEIWITCFRAGVRDEPADDAVLQILARHRIAAVADDTWKAIR